jgi:hypothetical protein
VAGERWQDLAVAKQPGSSAISRCPDRRAALSTQPFALWVPRLHEMVVFDGLFEHQKSPRARDQLYFTA